MRQDEHVPENMKGGSGVTVRGEDIDLVAGIVLFLFSLYVFGSGIYMCFFTVSGTQVWYYSPGFFPAFIGLVLMLLSVLLVARKYAAGGRIKSLAPAFSSLFRSTQTLRLFMAIGLFAGYVFLLIGRIPFVAATFIYLVATMTCFRTQRFAIWKIALISAIVTALIYVFFGIVASVPLP